MNSMKRVPFGRICNITLVWITLEQQQQPRPSFIDVCVKIHSMVARQFSLVLKHSLELSFNTLRFAP